MLFPRSSALDLSTWVFPEPLCPTTSTFSLRQSWPWWCIGLAVESQGKKKGKVKYKKSSRDQNKLLKQSELVLILTDIIIALSLSEFLAQGEGSKTLEFLRELLGSVGSERPRALPTELVEGVRLTHLIVLLLHHVQHIALSCMRWHLAVGVVGADDVQIVVYTHIHCVLIPQEAARRQEERGGYWQMSSPGKCFLAFKMNNNMINEPILSPHTQTAWLIQHAC